MKLKPFKIFTPVIKAKVSSVMAYEVEEVALLISPRGYFLLTMALGEQLVLDWTMSLN